MKPCPYCDWNDTHPYHYPDCPAIIIAVLERTCAAKDERIAALEKGREAAVELADEAEGCYGTDSDGRLDFQPGYKYAPKLKDAVEKFRAAIAAAKEGG